MYTARVQIKWFTNQTLSGRNLICLVLKGKYIHAGISTGGNPKQLPETGNKIFTQDDIFFFFPYIDNQGLFL